MAPETLWAVEERTTGMAPEATAPGSAALLVRVVGSGASGQPSTRDCRDGQPDSEKDAHHLIGHVTTKSDCFGVLESRGPGINSFATWTSSLAETPHHVAENATPKCRQREVCQHRLSSRLRRPSRSRRSVGACLDQVRR